MRGRLRGSAVAVAAAEAEDVEKGCNTRRRRMMWRQGRRWRMEKRASIGERFFF